MPTYPPHVLESPVRSCECQVQHYHGTRAAYQTCKCRCERCKESDRAYNRARARHGSRRDHLIDAAVVREIVNDLRAQGMTFLAISERSGVNPATVRAAMNGHAKRVRSSTVDMLKAVTPETMPTQRNRVPMEGSMRRLRHLALMGWPMHRIAEISGLHATLLKDVRIGARTEVNKATADAIARATNVLSRQTPKDTHSTRQTRAYATRQGWVSLFAYDDIDDPTEVPNVTPLVAPSKYATPVEEKLDELEYLLDAGTPVGDALRRVGYASFDSVEKVARRSRPALVARLQRLNRGEAA